MPKIRGNAKVSYIPVRLPEEYVNITKEIQATYSTAGMPVNRSEAIRIALAFWWQEHKPIEIKKGEPFVPGDIEDDIELEV